MMLLFGLATLMACIQPAFAHETQSVTAQISLRDGNLRVRIRLPAEKLIASEQLQAATQIRMDGQLVPLQVRVYPTKDQVMQTVAKAAIESDLGGHRHPAFVLVELESERAGWVATALEAQFPVVLGPVLATFFQPRTIRVPPHTTTQFPIMQSAEQPGPITAGANSRPHSPPYVRPAILPVFPCISSNPIERTTKRRLARGRRSSLDAVDPAY